MKNICIYTLNEGTRKLELTTFHSQWKNWFYGNWMDRIIFFIKIIVLSIVIVRVIHVKIVLISKGKVRIVISMLYTCYNPYTYNFYFSKSH